MPGREKTLGRAERACQNLDEALAIWMRNKQRDRSLLTGDDLCQVLRYRKYMDSGATQERKA